ncbi:hypothetical protein [Rhodocyclus tenuis]|uniref:hypothetical protein n=1 Tax=Rhodocyclus tenuis TaxID=1066 RepID=UPI001907DAA6|nr:hypothetical protein [Rhodocyclus tenuis]
MNCDLFGNLAGGVVAAAGAALLIVGACTGGPQAHRDPVSAQSTLSVLASFACAPLKLPTRKNCCAVNASHIAVDSGER